MIGEIAGQLTQRHMQGSKSIKAEQVVIDMVRIDLLLVELEVGDGEGIGGWVIADQVGAPRLDDLSQIFMVILTEQRRQRCVLVEGLRGRRFFCLEGLLRFRVRVAIEILIVHPFYMLRPGGDIDKTEMAAAVVKACLMQPLKQTVEEANGFLVVIEIHCFVSLFKLLIT